jgi:hypothetical protein
MDEWELEKRGRLGRRQINLGGGNRQMARNWAYSYRKMEHQLDLKMMRRGGG